MALNRDFGIGIFYFGLARKFPEIPCGKSRKDPEKILISQSVGPRAKKAHNIPRINAKSPGFGIFSWDWISLKKPTLVIIVMSSDL